MVAGAAPTHSTRQWAWLANLSDVGRALCTYLIVPNVIFLVGGAFVFLARPTFNADYLLLGCAAPFLSRRNVAIAFAILLGNDCLVSLAPAFHFDLSTGAVPITGSLTSRLLLYPLTIAMAIAIVLVSVLAERLGRTSGRRQERTTNGRRSLWLQHRDFYSLQKCPRSLPGHILVSLRHHLGNHNTHFICNCGTPGGC